MTDDLKEPMMMFAIYWDNDVGGFRTVINDGLHQEGMEELREAVALGLTSAIENLRNNTVGKDTVIGEDVSVVYTGRIAMQ